MRRAISILLALFMLLSLAACGRGGEATSTPSETENTPAQNPNAIELTLDNYNKYLQVYGRADCNSFSTQDALNVSAVNGGKGIETNNGSWTYYVYKSLILSASVNGLSQNFNYNDIVVTGKLTVKYRAYNGNKDENGYEAFTDVETFEKEIVLECDIAGNASFQEDYKLPDGTYTENSVCIYEFVVTGISGTVTPA